MDNMLTNEDMNEINDTVFSSEKEKRRYIEAYKEFLESFGPWEMTEGYPPMGFKAWKEWTTMDDEIPMDDVLMEIEKMVFSSPEEKAAFTKAYTRYYRYEMGVYLSSDDPWPMSPKKWQKFTMEVE